MSGDELVRVTDEMVVAFEEQYLATLYPDRREFALSPPGNTHFEAYRAGLRSALARSAPLSDELQEGRRLLEAAFASKSSRQRNSWDAWDWLANWFAYHGEFLLHTASQAESTAARLAEADALICYYRGRLGLERYVPEFASTAERLRFDREASERHASRAGKRETG